MARVTFAQEMYFPLQSTQCLSAYLKRAGHQTDVAIGTPSEIVGEVRETRPDVVAFSVLTSYRNHMLAATAALREAGLGVPLVAGGYDVTFMPQILEHCDLDAVCLGEGGDPVVELAGALDAGTPIGDTAIGNLHVKTADGTIRRQPMRYWTTDLDQVPLDDRDLYWEKDAYFRTIPFVQVLAGRGCPYPCTYCFNEGYKRLHMDAGMKGKEYTSLRSVEHVIDELRMLDRRYHPKDYFFNDSTLTYHRGWILAFCDAYRAAGLTQTFTINAVIGELHDDVCAALASTGKCRRIRFGLETGNEQFRFQTLRKRVANSEFVEVTDRLNRHGLPYLMQIMMGLPGETLELAWETIDVARRITGPTGVHGINIFKPFPGLEINNVGLELGEYQASDVMAPGSVPPPTWRQSAFEHPAERAEDAIVPAHESYLATRKDMHRVDGVAGGASVFGSSKMVFYDNFRRDALGLKILKLSRYSYLAIHFPGLRPLIERLIELPDNAFNRAVWWLTEGYFYARVHAGLGVGYLARWVLFHRRKKVR